MFTKEESGSFLIYPEQINKARAKLNNSQFGILFGAILDFAKDGTIYCDDPIIEAYFDMISHTLEIDKRKYEKRVEYRRENGKKGGRPKKEVTEQTKTPQKATKEEKRYHEPKEYTKEIVEVMTKKNDYNKLTYEQQAKVELVLFDHFGVSDEDIVDDEFVAALYNKIAKKLIEENHIYSMTYKNTKKHKDDPQTELVHFVNTFWDKYDKRKFIFNGQECYVDGNSYEIVLNRSRLKKPIEHERDIMSAIFHDEVEFVA